MSEKVLQSSLLSKQTEEIDVVEEVSDVELDRCDSAGMEKSESSSDVWLSGDGGKKSGSREDASVISVPQVAD